MQHPGSSPFRTKDPAAHARALGRAAPDDVHEFYGPFAMVDDLVELVRVVSPGYGEMDMAVLIYDKPLHIYVNSEAGERFLRERFPRVAAHRVARDAFRLQELEAGQALVAELASDEGPLRHLTLVVRARPDSMYVVERYESDDVWMSGRRCRGIDMRVAATARGTIGWEGEKAQVVEQAATLFRGSYGCVSAPAPAAAARRRTR